MDLNQLKYRKEEKEKDEKPFIAKTNNNFHPSNESLQKISLPRGYKKQPAILSSKFIFVISGGTNREKDYFHLLEKENVRRLKVVFVSKKNQGLTPEQMKEKADSFLKVGKFDDEGRVFDIHEGDIIYLLQDVDEYASRIKLILSDKPQKRVKWIISNPCFEIWLFYHFFDSYESELADGSVLSESKCSKWLKNKNNELVKGGINPITAFERIKTAIDNSTKNYADIDGLPSRFSTQMHILATQIVSSLGDELEKMLSLRTKRAEQFKMNAHKSIQVPILLSKENVDLFISGIKDSMVSDDNLPKMDEHFGVYLPIMETRIFPYYQKIEKSVFSTEITDPVTFISKDIVEFINRSVFQFYNMVLLTRSSVLTASINFNDIQTAINLLGIDENYAILNMGVDYPHGVDHGIYYKFQSSEQSFLIMRNEMVPRTEAGGYVGANDNLQIIDDSKGYYSNISNMSFYDNHYGLKVVRSLRFFYPILSNFRFIKFKVAYQNDVDKRELSKINKGCLVKLKYEIGDFVTIDINHISEFRNGIYNDSVFRISEINEDGTVMLNGVDKSVPYCYIEAVLIGGPYDKQIYFDPIIMASFLAPGEPIPVHQTDYTYYMDAFKKTHIENKNLTLYDLVMKEKVRYVHELQHWLRSRHKRDELKIHHTFYGL